MQNNGLKKLEEEREYLREWLANLGSAQDMAPEVQKKLEQIEWEISALKNSPEEAGEIPTSHLEAEIDRDSRSVPMILPMIAKYNLNDFSSLSGSTGVSGTASVYEFITRVGDLGTPDAQAYSRIFTRLYSNLEASQNRPNDIRLQLCNLGNQNTLDRFEEAYNGYYSYEGGVKDKKAVALSMRNFLDGMQGDLFIQARTQPKENMTWEIISKRLAKENDAVNIEGILIEQEKKRSSLIRRLSDILKDREGGAATNLEFIWTQLLDHVYIVLSSIDKNKLIRA